MLDDYRTRLKAWVQSLKESFGEKKPHFNFISIHYFWIIGATLAASIVIYAVGRGNIAYVDALLFAAGANTQAGLNTVDVNLLNTFQQVVIYIFTMLSSPITLHGCVVFLRLYWFEKRFQHLVRDARTRRGTISKSKSMARSDTTRPEEARGVQGRNITVVPRNGQNSRITNDGIVLDGDVDHDGGNKPEIRGSDSSDTNTMTGEPNGHELHALGRIEESRTGPVKNDLTREVSPTSHGADGPLGHQATISFADQVKRSDMLDDRDNIIQARSAHPHAEHIAILERQRMDEPDEVLRIPGPRDTERGLGPMRLNQYNEDDEEHNYLQPMRTFDSRVGASHPMRERHPTITIAEPEPRKRDDVVDELVDDAVAAGRTLESLRFRRPRAFSRGHKLHHEDTVKDDGEPHPATRVKTIDTLRTFLTRDKTLADMPYLSYTPTMGRNSNFVGLTLEQREELGGIEYRSLRTLALIILGYFWGFQILAFTFLLPWIKESRGYSSVVENIGQSPTWWGFWTANSAFMDLGLTLTPDSMISFATSQYVLMIMVFFIVIGNTGFPVMLRFVIWSISMLTPKGSGLWEELRFLLDHPRRCFTLLFPSSPTWWLFLILVILNAVDLIFFIILDLNADVVSRLSVSTRVVNGFFQSASTRTAGFSSVNLADLHPAMPVLYMVMMYISVFPIAISIRRTNVYEEKSLGVYQDKKDDDDHEHGDTAVSYVGTHLRRQLSFDLWYVALGFFIIAVSEGRKIQDGRFDLFSCLFEVISAYGTVGLSMGATGVNASLCSQFTVVGKLVIIAMMIRGRHRGLPYGLDRAVLLPSESRFQIETEDPQPIFVRTPTARTGRTSMAVRRTSSVPRPRSLSRTRDRNIITSLLHPGPVVPKGEAHSHRRNTSATSQGFSGFRLSQVQSQPIMDSDGDSLTQMQSREGRTGPRRSTTEPVHLSSS